MGIPMIPLDRIEKLLRIRTKRRYIIIAALVLYAVVRIYTHITPDPSDDGLADRIGDAVGGIICDK